MRSEGFKLTYHLEFKISLILTLGNFHFISITEL